MTFKLVQRFVVLVALFTLAAYCVRRWTQRPVEVAVLQYPREVNLGPRRLSSVAECPFRISNVSRREVLLDGFQTSCSCAAVQRRVEGQLERVDSLLLGPGESCDLFVHIGVGAKPGTSQTVNVLFRTNHSSEPVGMFRVLIPNIDGGLYSEPAVAMLGTGFTDSKLAREVEVFDNRIAGLVVRGVESSRPERFKAKLLPLSETDKAMVLTNVGRLVARVEVSANTDKGV